MVLTPKELESSRSFAGETSSGFPLPDSRSAGPSRTGTNGRPAFCELNGDMAHLRSGDANSSGTWRGSHQEQAHMSQLSLHTPENTSASSAQHRAPGGSPRSARGSELRQPLSRTDMRQQQGPLSISTAGPSSGTQLRYAEASTSRGGVGGEEEDLAAGRDTRGATRRALAAPSGRPATSHFVLQPSLTQSSGQDGAERNGQEQERRPTASSSGTAAPAPQPGMVRESARYSSRVQR